MKNDQNKCDICTWDRIVDFHWKTWGNRWRAETCLIRSYADSLLRIKEPILSFRFFHIWVHDKTTGYFIKRKNFEGLLFKALNTTEHFKIPLLSLPLLPSPIVVIHKALRYKLTCSVDHIIGQVILICCRVGGRVGKDTKGSLKEKSIELIIQNVWNWTDLGLGVYEKFSWNFLCYIWLTRGPI